MTDKTLEAHLRERLSDARALIGSLDISHDRVLLNFGAIGSLSRITLVIDENEISIAEPHELRVAWAEEDAAKRDRTPLDPAKALVAVYEGGELYAGKGGPKIALPIQFVEDLRAAAAFDPSKGPDGTQAPPQQPKGDGEGSTSKETGEGSQQQAPAPVPVDPDKHNRPALVELAKAEGVEIGEDDTKKVIAAKINEKRGIAA